MMLKRIAVFHFIRTFLLTLHRFDLFLQGALLIVILLESNVYLLLKRDANSGYNSGSIEDWVRIISGGIEFVFGAVLAWLGTGKRHLALAGWLAVTGIAGLLVYMFPYAYSRVPDVELCGSESIAFTSIDSRAILIDENATFRTAALVTTALLCALCKVSIWSHGLTYLDDHEPQNGPYFYGILISIRLSLGLSANNILGSSSVGEDWWVAHVAVCGLTLMFAVLFTLFPKRMPQWKHEEILVNTDFFQTLRRVARNKLVKVQTIALSLLTTAIFCFVQYDAAYVQARFHVETIRQDSRTSRTLSDIFRTLVVIFFVMIFRVRFSSRRCDGVKANTASRVGGVVAVLVAVFFAIIASIGCDVGGMVGLEGEKYEQPGCSVQCGCNSEIYGFSPVCGVGSSATFFSPCHAGCTDYEDINGFLLYHNCTCVADASVRAARGACALAACSVAFLTYQLFYALILAVSGASFLLQGMVLLRAVRRIDKPMAIGFSFSVIGLLSFVIGNMLYMFISHLTCAYASNDECLLHRPTLWIMCATSGVLALSSAAVSLVASKINPEPSTDL